jgi:hypothetical protein
MANTALKLTKPHYCVKSEPAMHKLLLWTIQAGILMCAVNASCIAQPANPHEEAIGAAEKFLRLIDQGEYGQTWPWLSEVFKKSITREQWLADLQAFRGTLGDLQKRERLHITESKDEHLGGYVIVQYQSLFANNQSKGEAVSLIKNNDGEWKILGYSLF